jgi:hypothetical protein
VTREHVFPSETALEDVRKVIRGWRKTGLGREWPTANQMGRTGLPTLTHTCAPIKSLGPGFPRSTTTAPATFAPPPPPPPPAHTEKLPVRIR